MSGYAILEELLSDEAMPIDDIFPEFEDEGIGDRTIRRAFKRLGGISESRQGETYWRLPH